MKTRILSAVVALPLLLFIVISGGIWLHVGVGLLGLIGMYEFNRAIAGEVKGAHIIAYLFGLFYVVFMDKLVYTQTLFSVFTSLFGACSADLQRALLQKNKLCGMLCILLWLFLCLLPAFSCLSRTRI